MPCDHKFQAFAIQDIQDLSNEINLKVNIAPSLQEVCLSDNYCVSLTVTILFNVMDDVSISVMLNGYIHVPVMLTGPDLFLV